ncbi:hypothetical protein KRR40_31810 [Niabella defluvii]|nr:hypothetical protein KRR40_31810 [Niabella sp. I65]
MLADGADEQFVIQRGGTPFFNTAGDRIYFETGSNNLSSCKLNGEDEKVLLKSTYGNNFRFHLMSNGLLLPTCTRHMWRLFQKPGKLSRSAEALPIFP